MVDDGMGRKAMGEAIVGGAAARGGGDRHSWRCTHVLYDEFADNTTVDSVLAEF